MIPSYATTQTNLTASARIGTSVAAHASADTKGAWTILVASTDAICYGFWVMVRGAPVASTLINGRLDIAYGDETTGGNEAIVWPDLDVGASPAQGQACFKLCWIPRVIAANKSVSVRLASNVGGQTVSVAVKLGQSPDYTFTDPTNVVAYGLATSGSGGTPVTPGNGAYGSWTQIKVGETTSEEHQYWAVGIDADVDAAFNSRDVLIELGYGATAPDAGGTAFGVTLRLVTESSLESMTGVFPPDLIKKVVPSGSKLWARLASATTVDVLGVIMYGVTWAPAVGGGPIIVED